MSASAKAGTYHGICFPVAKGLPGIDLGGTSRVVDPIRNDVYLRIGASFQGGLLLALEAQQQDLIGIAGAIGTVDQLLEPAGRDGGCGWCHGVRDGVRFVAILQPEIDELVDEIW